jgi:hypothetical protein
MTFETMTLVCHPFDISVADALTYFSIVPWANSVDSDQMAHLCCSLLIYEIISDQ